MKNEQKRVLAVHDISCMGKCSLTVAIPILSAAGLEVPCLPTAVLSTQTSGFDDYTFQDLTDNMLPVVDHWRRLGIGFDGIYTGFLGSVRQIDIMCDVIDEFGKDALVFVDPVMGDEGRLYDNFDEDFTIQMRKLVSRADIIFPNITEAALLLGREFPEGPLSRKYIHQIMQELSALGPKKIILTGVFFNRYKLGAAAYDSEKDEVSYFFSDKVPGIYYGTGDIFSSVTIAGIMNGLSLAKSINVAVDFTQRCIERTYKAKTDVRLGVDFEEGIPKMLADMNLSHLSDFI